MDPLILGYGWISIVECSSLLICATQVGAETFYVQPQKIECDHPNAAQLVAGDFNLPDVNWQTDTIEGHIYPYEINKNYINMANDLVLTQVVDFPTCENATLDLFFTKRPSLVNQSETLPGISDHEIV